jgi:hypothetical protein
MKIKRRDTKLSLRALPTTLVNRIEQEMIEIVNAEKRRISRPGPSTQIRCALLVMRTPRLGSVRSMQIGIPAIRKRQLYTSKRSYDSYTKSKRGAIMSDKAFFYIRVSTAQQGRSGRARTDAWRDNHVNKNPPSTVTTLPVIYREAPDASSRIAPSRSVSLPTRRCGIRLVSFSPAGVAQNSWFISVSI